MQNQIATMRKIKGIKQKDLAEKLGIKVDTLGTWERGKREFTFKDACAIADVLECTLDELAGRVPPYEPKYWTKDQENLNHYWESMNRTGRSALLESARLMSGSDDVRIEKDSEEFIPIQAKVGA